MLLIILSERERFARKTRVGACAQRVTDTVGIGRDKQTEIEKVAHL
jgi:hypothetical protein